MKSSLKTPKTVLLIVGVLILIIALVQMRTSHNRSQDPGIMLLTLTGFVLAVFGSPRGAKGFLADTLEGRGKSVPEQLRSVEFHGTTSVEPNTIIQAAVSAAGKASELSSTVRVEDAQSDCLQGTIKGLGALVTQLSFTVSWREVAERTLQVDVKVGHYLTRQPTLYWVIPIGRKRVVGLPAMHRFRDEFAAQLNAHQTRPTPNAQDMPSAIVQARATEPPVMSLFLGETLSPDNGVTPPPFTTEEGDTVPPAANAQRIGAAGKAGSTPHQLDDSYLSKAGEPKPILPEEPKTAFSSARLGRRRLGVASAGLFILVLILGIFLGQNSWRPSVQGSVQAAGSGAQPAAPSPPYTPPAPSYSPPQVAQAAAGAAAVPAQAEPQPVLPPTQAAAPLPGDLGLTSPLRPVGCTGQYIVVYHSSTDPSVYAQDIQTNLQSHPGSKYLLTLSSCSSLNRMSKAGTMIYTVYGGPYDTLAQACVAASRFPDESYVKIMDSATAPDQAIQTCQ
ncbi:hypothetical protein ACFVVC_01720 [Pseudarthrobacter sp. NPDC058196]|uniref:hypothetical protein n=1 Tax=Pseudarthrobacter sp. NPDC058196 TaxID=3346376 RepID=UPI0036DA00EF